MAMTPILMARVSCSNRFMRPLLECMRPDAEAVDLSDKGVDNTFVSARGHDHGNSRESDVESPLKSPPEELTRLRDTLNELRDIMARPALWAGGAPPSVAHLSMDTL